ncbi:MAG TPA: porin family protein [Saprospiraceae bacterium]|nr:porin family protein [Saprospiraceae bacterium]HPI05902.1 porin family protein [Saprospiraceae bacterium]
MKTIQPFLLTLLLFMCAAPHLSAQLTEGKPRFGLKFGVSGSSLYDDANADDKKSRIGITGGGFVKIPVGKHLALRPELLFTTKGAEFDFIGGNTSDLKLSYLEIPLSLELNIAIINIHAGVHAGLLATAEGTFKDSQGNAITTDFGKEDLESFDYGWHVGGGIDLGNIGIHLRVSRGLQDISKDDSVADVFGSLKNASWSLTAAYGF